ncbi:MAG: alpha/beta fold hydrolase, partial [Gemmatimonadaceae bacterium]
MHEPPYWPLTLIRSGHRGGGAVFCLPGAGASVTAFAEFAAWIEPSLAVYGMQPRGIDGVHPPHPSAKAAADAYLPVILKTQRNGPVHLIGHSFGGWIAFEIATRLHRASCEVGSLTV